MRWLVICYNIPLNHSFENKNDADIFFYLSTCMYEYLDGMFVAEFSKELVGNTDTSSSNDYLTPFK